MHAPLPRKPAPWKGPADVKRIRFITDARGRPLAVGKGGLGAIYAGKIQFEGGKTRRVAIKQFRWARFFQSAPEGSTMDDFVRAVPRAIQRLRELGIPIPKMGLVKMSTPQHPEGEYVLVSSLFASTSKSPSQRSHFKPNKTISKRDPLSVKQAALTISIKLFNAGHESSDLFAPYRRPRAGVRPIDIDGMIYDEMRKHAYRGKPELLRVDDYDLGHSLNDLIAQLARNHKEYDILLAQAHREAKPELRKYLARRGSI